MTDYRLGFANPTLAKNLTYSRIQFSGDDRSHGVQRITYDQSNNILWYCAQNLTGIIGKLSCSLD